MIPFVLPNVLLIAESCTNEEYDQLIFPKLKPVLKIQDPIQVQINTLRNVLWENTKSSINYLKIRLGCMYLISVYYIMKCIIILSYYMYILFTLLHLKSNEFRYTHNVYLYAIACYSHSIQVVLILLKKMDLLLTKTPKEAIQFHVLPMVFQALEAPSHQVQVRIIQWPNLSMLRKTNWI